jgi:tryptophanase
VSLENIKAVKKLSDQYGIPVIFDSARFAENAYFIKTREEGQSERSIKEICREMFSYGMGMTMSSKKDGLVNIGGFIALNNEESTELLLILPLFMKVSSYGGMAGRDMAALAQGLDEATEFDYLKSRITQMNCLEIN